MEKKRTVPSGLSFVRFQRRIGSFFTESEFLLNFGCIESHDRFPINDDDGDGLLAREGDHLVSGCGVLRHILLRVKDAFLRKKLFRILAVRSRGCGVDHDLVPGGFHILFFGGLSRF